MPHIDYGNTRIAYRVKKTSRVKTIALQVRSDSQVVILVPRFLIVRHVQEIVRKRARWILEKQAKLKLTKAALPKKEFVSGEAFSYLGREYRLKVVRTEAEASQSCRLVNGRFLVGANSGLSNRGAASAVREALSKWYRERAEVKIRERIRAYMPLTGKEPKEVLLGNQQKRWGSCSRSGVLRFNWKIIMAPISVFDYVIVHELCHLVHANHSADFWRVVGSIVPEYQAKRTWLKDNSALLSTGLG